MKKPKPNQRKLAQKRARKAAKRKKILKEKSQHYQAVLDMIHGMSEEELKEFFGDDYHEEDCECDECTNY